MTGVELTLQILLALIQRHLDDDDEFVLSSEMQSQISNLVWKFFIS